MNKFRNFCVALSLLVAYTSSACWYPTYEPQYYLTYNAEYEVENGSQTSNMIKMWQKLIPGASEQDVKSLIYSDGYGIDEIRYLKVPYHLQSRLSRNNNELRDYIILMRQTAKECDKTTDPWYFYYDNDPRLQILDSLADVAMSRLDGQLGDRYAIQAARALRATRKFDDIIALFNRHQFNDYELKSIFEESLASAYYHTGRYDDALKIYRRKDDERSLQWTLEKLGKASDKLALALQLSYEKGKEASILWLLQAHIREMELANDHSARWYWCGLSLPEIGRLISTARTAANKGMECYKPLWQYTEGFSYLLNPVDYAKADSVFAQINLREASAHIRNQVRTLRFITQSFLRPYDAKYKDWFAREAQWLCDKGSVILADKRYEREKHESDYRWRSPLCKEVIFYRNTHQSYCYPLDMLHRASDCIVVPKMLEAGDTVSALQLLDLVDHAGLTKDEIRFADSHGCASICFAMECGADIAMSARLSIGKNDNWAKLLKNNGSILSFPDRWNDLIGTLMLAEARYGEAVDAFEPVSDSYACGFDSPEYDVERNPFAILFLSVPMCRLKETKMTFRPTYYKKWFALRMANLQKEMSDGKLSQKEKAEKAIEYAVGMANSVYPCWSLTRYGVGSSPFFPYHNLAKGDKRRPTEICHDFNCEEYFTVDHPSDFEKSSSRMKHLRHVSSDMLHHAIAVLPGEEAAKLYLQLGQYLTIKHHFSNTQTAQALRTSCDRWSDW